MCQKMLILFGVLSLFFGNVVGHFNFTDYYKMPPLHRTGDIGRCLYSTEDYNVNCIVFTIIKPDNTSEAWHQIEVFSDDVKRHFRHDFIHAAICLKECEEQLSGLTELERDELFVEEFPWKIGRKWYDDGTTFKDALKHRELYGRKMNQCVNLWLRNNYNLSGTSKIHFCNTNKDAEDTHYDHWHYIFISVNLLILSVVLYATIWDAFQNKDSTLGHYKRELPSLSTTKDAFLSFSLIRNWFRLTSHPKTELAKDIRFTSGVRYITMLIFVLAHQLLSYSMAPMINPEFIEETYHNVNTLALNNLNTVQTFFILSGFLLYITVSQMFKKREFNFKYFLVAILYRYVRLAPVLMYVVLFDASFLYDTRVSSGGYWKFFAEARRTYCRRNWWTNALFINNYVNQDQMCKVESWYVAADTQLFLVTLFLFMFMFKYPKIQYWIFGVAFMISCGIQFIVNYINGFDGMFLATPEMKRTIYYNMHDEFKYDFITAHMYLSNYLSGVFAGMLYIYIKRKRVDLGQSKTFVTLWYVNPVFGQLLLSTGAYVFYNYNFERSIWLSLISVLMHNIWGVSAIILFLGFISKFESGAKRFLNWHVFTSLGRLSYSIYIIHLTLTSFIFGGSNSLASFSYPELFMQTIGLFVIANLLALVLCLCIEFPMTALAKMLLRGQKRKAEETVELTDKEQIGIITIKDK